MKLSLNMSLNELKEIPEFFEVADFIRYFPGAVGHMAGETLIKDTVRFGWNPESLLFGLKRLEEVCRKGRCLYRIYPDAPDGMKHDVSLMFFPKTADTGLKPFIILCPGGGFISVGSVSEGFPVAAELNARGYDVFILTYTVGYTAALPVQLDDLAAAVRYVFDHRSVFGVSGKYIVGGCSAGGYMTALWGTDNHGYASYGLPAPEAMFPVYAIADPALECDDSLYNLANGILFARKRSSELYEEYNVSRHMSRTYPPCYIVCGKNDITVPPENSQMIKDGLDALGISAQLEMPLNAPHGFGDGRGTDAFGWIGRACEFLESLCNAETENEQQN